MKRLLSALFAVALALPVIAQVPATLGGGVAERVAILEAPRVTAILSNAASAQIDFRQGNFQYTNGINVGTADYEVKNLANALTLNLTNLVPGVVRRVFITTDGTARAITVSTNGITSQTRLSYDFTSITNGASTFTATNRAYIEFRVRPTGEVYSRFGWIQ